MAAQQHTQYIKYPKSADLEGDKLFCLGHAGGGASFFAGWHKYFTDGPQILPIQLPGRENRIGEPLISDPWRLAVEVADAIEPLLDTGTFGIFGHSMGGILAFEVTRILEERGYQPAMLAISATTIYEDPAFILSSTLAPDAFMERVFVYGAIDQESPILQYPEFQEIFLDILRADFNVVETYRNHWGPIKTSILALCGDSDNTDSISGMGKWEQHTSGGVSYREFEGDHFYINSNLQELAGLLKHEYEQGKARI